MRPIHHRPICEREPLTLLKNCQEGSQIELRRLPLIPSRTRRSKNKAETMVCVVRSVEEDGLICDDHDIAWCGCSSMGWFVAWVI
jgi:hypothetical protein